MYVLRPGEDDDEDDGDITDDEWERMNGTPSADSGGKTDASALCGCRM
jgi:hypothetical protein